MIVAEIEDPGLEERLGQSATFGMRSTGIHYSDLVKPLLLRLDPEKYGQPIDDLARRRMEIGILFENVLEQGLREKYGTLRVGEIYSPEGVAMSPDGVNPTYGAGEEYKATYKSCRHGLLDDDGKPLDNFVSWFIQMKAYAKHLELLDWLLRVLFICGDYTRPIRPLFKSYRIRFTQEEVDDNWNGLIGIGREEGLLP